MPDYKSFPFPFQEDNILTDPVEILQSEMHYYDKFVLVLEGGHLSDEQLVQFINWCNGQHLLDRDDLSLGYAAHLSLGAWARKFAKARIDEVEAHEEFGVWSEIGYKTWNAAWFKAYSMAITYTLSLLKPQERDEAAEGYDIDHDGREIPWVDDDDRTPPEHYKMHDGRPGQ